MVWFYDEISPDLTNPEHRQFYHSSIFSLTNSVGCFLAQQMVEKVWRHSLTLPSQSVIVSRMCIASNAFRLLRSFVKHVRAKLCRNST